MELRLSWRSRLPKPLFSAMSRAMPALRPLLGSGVGLLVGLTLVAEAGPSPAKPVKSSPPAVVQPAPSLDLAPQDTFSNVARVVAIGDVHGDVTALRECLILAGLIDAQNHWVGGKTHLVQTGDIPDRSDNTRQAMDLLMQLEQEAPKVGGRVIALLGNHEVMNMDGDLRYVTPGEMASYADLSPESDPPGTPRGTRGHAMAFSAEGRYGRWLRSHAGVAKVNDSLFLHGGIGPGVTAKTLPALNRWIRQDLFPGNPAGGARIPTGPLWFRGYALEPEASLRTVLDEVLQRFGAKRMVMGHTTTEGELVQRFNGKAIFIDTGISAHYGHHLAALEIKGGTVTGLYVSGKVPLKAPEGETPPLK